MEDAIMLDVSSLHIRGTFLEEGWPSNLMRNMLGCDRSLVFCCYVDLLLGTFLPLVLIKSPLQ